MAVPQDGDACQRVRAPDLDADRQRSRRMELVAHEVLAHPHVQQDVVRRAVGVPTTNRVQDPLPRNPVGVDHRVRVVRGAMVGTDGRAQAVALVPGIAHHSDRLVPPRGMLGRPAAGRQGRADVLVVRPGSLHDLDDRLDLGVVVSPVRPHARAGSVGDCYAPHPPDLGVQVLCVVPDHVRGGDRGYVACRVAAQCVRLLVPDEEWNDLALAVCEEHIAMAVGLRHAALVTEDARVGLRHMVHVRHLLRIPPPVVVRAALVVGRGTEVHRRRIDHVTVELLQVAVVSAAAVPAQLSVPVEVAAHDLHLATVHGRSVAANSVQVRSLVGMPWLDLHLAQI